VTAPYTFTFDTPPAPELLAQWCFEMLSSAAWMYWRLAAEHVEAKHGRRMTRDEARDVATLSFQQALDRIPEASPVRAALERFIEDYVLPTIDDEDVPPSPPKLKLVP
jgi:hypothetical protein